MAYAVEGDYFEVCNCKINCRCIFDGGDYDGDACDAFLSWHITGGQKDDTALAGLNVSIARHSVKGKERRVVLYVDERATSEQATALEAIFSGKSGGHPAVIAPIMGEISAVRRARIEFEKRDGRRSVRVGDVLEAAAEQVVGMDKKNPSTIANPSRWAGVPQPLRQGRSLKIRYVDDWQFAAEGTNSFMADFRFEA
jgi:hypothetical protein